MSNKIKTLIWAAVIAVVLFGIGIISGWNMRAKRCNPVVVSDTVTLTETDTVFIDSPSDTVTKTEYEKVFVPYYITNTDTVHDSVTIILPYEHHFARLDTVADVWYSGYDAKIDSAKVYKSETTHIVHVTREVYKMPILTLNFGAKGVYDSGSIDGYAYGKLAYSHRNMVYYIFGGYGSDFKGNNRPFYGGGAEFSISLLK